MSRTIIVGGPRCGKSTLARQYRARGVPVFCGDPLSKVKEPEAGVNYLPEFDDLPESERWSAGSNFIANIWFQRPGPWLMEGQIMARALRKWTAAADPCDEIIVLRNHHPKAVVSAGQRSMHKAVMTVWSEIEHRFAHLVRR